MELLMWLEQIEIWRLEREHADPKQEDSGQCEDDELPVANYPLFNEPFIPIGLIKSSSPNL